MTSQSTRGDQLSDLGFVTRLPQPSFGDEKYINKVISDEVSYFSPLLGLTNGTCIEQRSPSVFPVDHLQRLWSMTSQQDVTTFYCSLSVLASIN